MRWPPLAAFPRHRAARVQLTADGASLSLTPVLHVAIGNGRFQGGGMEMCPGAALDDGLLDITAIGDLSARELARDFRVLYSA